MDTLPAVPTRTLTDAARDLLVPTVVDLDRDPDHAGPLTARVPSLLDQVRAAVESSRGTGQRSGAGPHRSPIGLSAVDVVADVERVCGRGPGPLLSRRVWAWVRTRHRADFTAVDTVERWISQARAVVDPPRPVSLRTARCPACRARTVRVMDAGEWVIRPALEVDRATVTARCLARGCGATWGPERLSLLAAVLEQEGAGQPTPHRFTLPPADGVA